MSSSDPNSKIDFLDSAADVKKKIKAAFCEEKNMAGINADGGFAEYVIADSATSVLLPDGLPFEQAAPLMCAGVCELCAALSCIWLVLILYTGYRVDRP